MPPSGSQRCGFIAVLAESRTDEVIMRVDLIYREDFIQLVHIQVERQG